jgi:hypothetical protein
VIALLGIARTDSLPVHITRRERKMSNADSPCFSSPYRDGLGGGVVASAAAAEASS